MNEILIRKLGDGEVILQKEKNMNKDFFIIMKKAFSDVGDLKGGGIHYFKHPNSNDHRAWKCINQKNKLPKGLPIYFIKEFLTYKIENYEIF